MRPDQSPSIYTSGEPAPPMASDVEATEQLHRAIARLLNLAWLIALINGPALTYYVYRWAS